MYCFGKVEMSHCYNTEKYCKEILNIILYIKLPDEIGSCYKSKQNSMVSSKNVFFCFVKTNHFYISGTNMKRKSK